MFTGFSVNAGFPAEKNIRQAEHSKKSLSAILTRQTLFITMVNTSHKRWLERVTIRPGRIVSERSIPMWGKFKEKFIGDKNFYKYVLYLAVPMIVQNTITSFVSFLDNIMVGQIGTEQMSGVAIVNQLMFVFNVCIFGGVSGAGIFGTQYYGKGDYEGQKHAFRFKLYACLLVTAVAALLFSFFDTQLISLYLNDTGI